MSRCSLGGVNFRMIFTTKVSDMHRSIDSNIEQFVVEQRQSSAGVHAQSIDSTPDTRKDITRIVRTSTTKTCDLDPIPTYMVKDNIDLLAPLLTDIINITLQTGIVPTNMKHALVLPVLKKRCLDANIANPFCIEGSRTVCRNRTTPIHG